MQWPAFFSYSANGGIVTEIVKKPGTVDGYGGRLTLVRRATNQALTIQHSLVARHVARMRRNRPEAPPAELVGALERHFMAAVTTSGAAVGGAAAAPGVGTGVAAALSAGEVVTFLEAATLFVLAVAEVHGLPVHDLERRRTLV